MQQLILENKSLLSEESSHFPEFIRYFQYNPKSPNPYDGSKNSKNGSIGNGAYAYLVDCMHKCLANADEPDGFKKLIDTLRTYRSPLISRDFIFNYFYIVEIPDFSHEAMTQGYNDFVVYLFNPNGSKIPQRFIGLIKEYSSRRCFILIDKTYKSGLNVTFKIIVEFKRNFELDINGNKDSCTDHIFTDKYDYSFYSNRYKYNA